MNLSHKVICIVVGVSVIVASIIGLIEYRQGGISIQSKIDKDLEIIANRLSSNLKTPIYAFDKNTINHIIEAEFLKEDVAGIVVWSEDRESIIAGVKRESGKLIHTEDFSNLNKLPKITQKLYFQKTDGPQALLAEIDISINPRISEKHLIDNIIRSQGALFFIIIVISFLISFIINRYISSPLDEMQKVIVAIEKAAKSDIQQDISINMPKFNKAFKEIKRLNESFQLMLSTLNDKDRSLRESEENLRITLNSIGDAVITTDKYGFITGLNPIAEKLTGWSRDDARGEKLVDVFDIFNSQTGETCENPVTKVIESGKIVGLANHTSLKSKDGSTRQIADSGAPIRNKDEDIVGVVLVFRDVSGQYELEEQLRQSQKMDAVGQLAGGIAHDFNNLLSAIMGSAELLNIKLKSESNLKYVRIINKTSNRASELINKLLIFSHKSEIISEALDINFILTDTLSILKSSFDKKIKFVFSTNAEQLTITGDKSQIQNAIMNLCINARDAMPDGGIISIDLMTCQFDEHYCSASPFDLSPGHYVQINIKDNGSGIPLDEIKRIFDPFYTT
ncbi:MAG: PAS domain S-box protein, partial [Lentisphaeria bacterium]|nr:PAS domain S-box protein [Lentisphaeria bacterium]